MKKHEENLQANFLSTRFIKPFLGATGETELDSNTIKEAYVDLAVITGKEVDEKFLNSNRNYHLQQIHLKKRSVRLKDLLNKEDRCAIVSGVPGIGKSSLVKKIVLEWQERRLLRGENKNPNIRFLFPILCRELNAMDEIENESPLAILL